MVALVVGAQLKYGDVASASPEVKHQHLGIVAIAQHYGLFGCIIGINIAYKGGIGLIDECVASHFNAVFLERLQQVEALVALKRSRDAHGILQVLAPAVFLHDLFNSSF